MPPLHRSILSHTSPANVKTNKTSLDYKADVLPHYPSFGLISSDTACVSHALLVQVRFILHITNLLKQMFRSHRAALQMKIGQTLCTNELAASTTERFIEAVLSQEEKQGWKSQLLVYQNEQQQKKRVCVYRCYVAWRGESTKIEVNHQQPIIQKPAGYNKRNHFRHSGVMCNLNLQTPRYTLYSETIRG